MSSASGIVRAGTDRMPRLYTPCEAARALRIGRDRLYELIHTGELGAVRPAKRKFLIPESELVRYLAELEAAAHTVRGRRRA